MFLTFFEIVHKLNQINMLLPLTKVRLLILCSLLLSATINLNAQSLFINEVMSRNESSNVDKDGEYSDWIELYNSSNNPINLNNYGLSDNEDDLNKWTFPDVEISSQSFLLVYASGKDYNANELHSNFSIKGSGENLFLTNTTGEIIDSVEAVDILADQSYGRSIDGAGDWVFFSTPTPAITNTNGVVFNQQTAITLNEIQSYNTTSIQDQFGEYSDWIELHNSSSQAVNLNGYSISDDSEEPHKWIFPEVSIEAGGYLLVFASGRDLKENELHCNFEISTSGEDLFLYDATGLVIGFISEQQLVADQSYGRTIDGTGDWEEFYYSTPNENNANGNVKQKLDFSHKPGQYAQAFELNVYFEDEQTNNELSIYYTTDGSEPNTNSNLYQSALTIASRAGEPNYYSSSQFETTLNPYDPVGEVYKINVIRCRIFKNDKPASKIYTKSYMIHPDFDRYTLPMVSLVSDPDGLFSGDKGIYVVGNNYDGVIERTMNCFQRGKDWERKAHFEFFMEDEEIIQNGGLRIHGGGSRREAQKAFRLYARSEYDSENTFDYPFFPDKPIQEYKRLLLRAQNSSNDSYMTDEVVSNICRNVNIDRMATRPVVVFLNGEYWGLYSIRERIDKYYLENNYGVDEDDVTLLHRSPYNISCCEIGTADEYIELLTYLAENDINDPQVYNYVEQKIDLEQYANYLVTQFWAANRDWPSNNIRYWKAAGDNAKWRWIMYDVDFGLRFHEQPTILNYLGNLINSTNEISTELGNRLFKSQVFTNMFIEIFEHHLATTFTPKNVACEIFTYRNLMAPEIEESFNRYAREITFDTWQFNVRNMYEQFAAFRPCEIKNQIAQQFGVTINIDACSAYIPTENPCSINEVDCQNLSISLVNIPALLPIDTSINLIAEPPGGTFSGPGVLFNKLNTSILQPGMHTITYTYNSDDGCTISQNKSVLVYSIEFNFVNYILGAISPKNINKITLAVKVMKEDVYNFEVFDISGKKIFQKKRHLKKGYYTEVFSLEDNLPKGIFLVNVSTDKYSYHKKFVQ